MREADIRPAELLNEYLRLSAEDAEIYFGDGKGFTDRPCPGCGETASTLQFTKAGFSYVRCDLCATLYANPGPSGPALESMYRDSESATYWANVFSPAVAEVRRDAIFKPRVEQIADLLDGLNHRLQRLCDIGVGTGLYLEEVTKHFPGTELSGVEPSSVMAQACQKKGFHIFEGFSDQAAESPDWASSADLVTSFEVIEHVPDSLGFVSSLAALARPGGLVLITGLCGDGFDIKVLGARSKAVSPPHHLNFLSRDGVRRLLERAGLDEVQFTTPGQLDVDIVRNVLLDDDDAVDDPKLRAMLLDEDEQVRKRFQARLVAEKQSSHMWIVARRPLESA